MLSMLAIGGLVLSVTGALMTGIAKIIKAIQERSK